MPDERERIGKMLRALLDRAETTGGFSGDNNWEPLVVIDAITGGFGITWNTPIGDPLVIGLGAKASNVGGEPINLAVLAKLLRIQTRWTRRPRARRRRVRGDLPGAGLPRVGFARRGRHRHPEPGRGVGGPEGDDQPIACRGLAHALVPDAGRPDAEILGWDASRLAVYVLKAFVAQRAATGEVFFQRVLEHLFPMLGDDPAEVIDPLPIVDEMGQQADFTEWSESVLPGEDAGGALTFLWHLRALLDRERGSGILARFDVLPTRGRTLGRECADHGECRR